MRVLVTGGAGYVGSHVCKALARAGHLPITFDNLSSGHAWAVNWGPLEQGDICDFPRLLEVMAQHGPQAVIHLAALSSVRDSFADPIGYHRVNFTGTQMVIEAARGAGAHRIVFSSTCAIYGPAQGPIREDHRQAPISPYGTTKLLAEEALAAAADRFGIRPVALRYFNAAGADPEGQIGEAHDPETHLIPLVLEAAAEGRTVQIYGARYPTRDGTCVRDYVHVSDLADAHLQALELTEGRDGFWAFNLGTGRGISNHELVQVARRVTGREIKVYLAEPRPGDAASLTADPCRAQARLGWFPRLSDIDTVVETAWRWRCSR